MAKAILVMDMPSSCCECRMFYEKLGTCELTGRLVECGNESERQEWCPLREVPSKHEDGHTVKIAIENDCYDGFEYERAYCDGKDAGYNACIDEILGGGE